MFEPVYLQPQATSSLIGFNIAYFVLMIIFLWSQRNYFLRIKSGYNIILVVFLSLFCVFSFYDSDWFSYFEIYNGYELFYDDGSFDFSLEHLFGRDERGHMETIYFLLYKLSFGNYLYFRFYIWGAAILFLAITARHLNVGTTAFYIIFTTCFLLYFCYGRVSLAYAVAFMGFSFVIKPFSNRIVSLIIGVTIIGLSLLFHKTALFVIPILLISLVPLKKNAAKFFVLWAIPIILILYLLQGYISHIDAEDNLAVSTLQGKLSDTTESTFSGSFIRQLISKYLVYLPYYIFFFGIIRRVNNGHFSQYPQSIRHMASAACWVVYLSTILLLADQYLMFYRLMLYSIIPISVTLASLYINSKHADPLVKTMLYSGLLVSTYKLAYVFYLSLVN